MASNIYWGAMIKEGFSYLTKCDLTAADYQVFFHLCRIAEPETNIANERQIDIVNNFIPEYNIQINKSTVSKAIRKLIDKSIILKPDNKGGFMINPAIFYYGTKPKQLEKMAVFAKYALVNEKDEILVYEDTTHEIYLENPQTYLDNNSETNYY